MPRTSPRHTPAPPSLLPGRALTALTLLWACSLAQAHAFEQRYELPLPLGYFIGGAALAVGLSFWVIAVVVRGSAPWPEKHWVVPTHLAQAFVTAMRAFGLGMFILVVTAGLGGAQGDWDSNPLPVWIWVIWWIGLAFIAALVGNLWPLLDPWRTVAHWLPRTPPRRWPPRLDVWPAVVLFFGFACTELAWSQNAVPDKLATLVLLYSAITWVGMTLFGLEVWCEKADPFHRFFALFACCAPLSAQRRETTVTLTLRLPGAGLALEKQASALPPSPAATSFVLLMLSTVAFDGLGETPFWDQTMGLLSAWLYATGALQFLGYAASDSLIKVAGLAVTPLIFAAIYLVTCAAMARISGEGALYTAQRYVLTLVPIAVAYHLAHYLTYLLVQGQMIWPLLSDPFDRGWNLLGGRGFHRDPSAVDTGVVWLTALIAIVCGHVMAIWLAHKESMRTHNRQQTWRLQIPMLVLMISYTLMSLWILSQPVVQP